MADPEQLRILLGGVAAWNKWRDRAGRGVPIDLSRAVFHGTNLRGANLSNADLHEAFFDEADLCEAGLRGANLRKASFSIYPNHSRATNLSGADLRHAG
jgi:uncharacterized protein YjbI with pentapeptide repeats